MKAELKLLLGFEVDDERYENDAFKVVYNEYVAVEKEHSVFIMEQYKYTFEEPDEGKAFLSEIERTKCKCLIDAYIIVLKDILTNNRN